MHLVGQFLAACDFRYRNLRCANNNLYSSTKNDKHLKIIFCLKLFISNHPPYVFEFLEVGKKMMLYKYLYSTQTTCLLIRECKPFMSL